MPRSRIALETRARVGAAGFDDVKGVTLRIVQRIRGELTETHLEQVGPYYNSRRKHHPRGHSESSCFINHFRARGQVRAGRLFLTRDRGD
jgi:hypothetical protein